MSNILQINPRTHVQASGDEEKYEMWTVFGGQLLHFLLSEFATITGLLCTEFPEGYDPYYQPPVKSRPSHFWKKVIGPSKKATLADISGMLENSMDMPSWRKLALALILIVDGVLIVTHQIHKPTPKYVEMLEDVDGFLSFPWGA